MVFDKNHDNHISSDEIADESRYFLDQIVSLFVYAVAVILVGYMLITLGRDLTDFYLSVSNLFRLQDPFAGIDIAVEQNLLHTIAFTIVLVKAYRILMSYAKTHHLNIEFLIKLAIAAPLVEVLFNAHHYELPMLIFFGAFSITNLMIYLYFYARIRQIVKDHIFELSQNERG